MKVSTLPTLVVSYKDKLELEKDRILLSRLMKKDELPHFYTEIVGNDLKLSFNDENDKNDFIKKIVASKEAKEFPTVVTSVKNVPKAQPAQTDVINPMIALLKIKESGVLNEKTPPVPPPPVDYLVFQGGGAKGDTLFGCLSVLDQIGILRDVKAVFGSSVGALTALLVSTGLSGDQIKDFCVEYFDPRNLINARKSVFGDRQAGKILHVVRSMILKGGGFGHPETAQHVIRNILRNVTGNPECTFAEFEEARKQNPALKSLICTATWLPSEAEAKELNIGPAGVTKLFSAQTSPDVVMADAILASMCLPPVWTPVTIRKKEGNEFKTIGTFADGGILNNLPIDIVNNFINNPEYQSLPRKNAKGEIIFDNPCGLSFSMCDPEELNPAVCPVPPVVQKFIPKYQDDTRQREKELESYQVLARNELTEDLLKEVEKTAVQATTAYELAANPSNIDRLLKFHAANKAEDIKEKARLHPEGHINLYNGGVAAADLGLPRAIRDKLIMIGDLTIKDFFNQKRDVTKEYLHPDYHKPENLDYPNDDSRKDKLNALFEELAAEVEKYNDPNAASVGYSWDTMHNNIKIQNLYWKIHYLFSKLQQKPTTDFETFVSEGLSNGITKFNEVLADQKTKSNELFNRLANVKELVEDLSKTLKEKPFNANVFETAFQSLGASMAVKIMNDYPQLLLNAAIENPEALQIMLSKTETFYTEMHQNPGTGPLADLGKTRIPYEKALSDFKDLANKTFDEKPIIFHAIDKNQPKSVTSLLQHHVSRDIQYNDKSIFQYAIDKGNADCLIAACLAKTEQAGYRRGRIELYKSKEAAEFSKFMNRGLKNDRNLAHYLFENKNKTEEILTKLLEPENERVWNEFAKQLNKADKSGITPLHIAAAHLSPGVFEQLKRNKIYALYEKETHRSISPQRLQPDLMVEYMEKASAPYNPSPSSSKYSSTSKKKRK